MPWTTGNFLILLTNMQDEFYPDRGKMIFRWLTSCSYDRFPVAMDTMHPLESIQICFPVRRWWWSWISGDKNLPPTLYSLLLFTPPRNNCESENSYMEIRPEIAYKSLLSSFPQTVVDLWYTLMPHCYGHTILVIWNHIHTPSGTTYRL